MPKSQVEQYQQILETDPGSLVFIELAKALLDRGSASRAAEICRRGIEHHPDSVVGRVLWGKALLNAGNPTEAMEQFDQAIANDREDPAAYNLIGEVLLQKRLYRSALPVLRKAVSLQPGDRRVRQWLELAQRGGAPAPRTSSRDTTEVELLPAMATREPAGPAAAGPEQSIRGDGTLPAPATRESAGPAAAGPEQSVRGDGTLPAPATREPAGPAAAGPEQSVRGDGTLPEPPTGPAATARSSVTDPEASPRAMSLPDVVPTPVVPIPIDLLTSTAALRALTSGAPDLTPVRLPGVLDAPRKAAPTPPPLVASAAAPKTSVGGEPTARGPGPLPSSSATREDAPTDPALRVDGGAASGEPGQPAPDRGGAPPSGRDARAPPRGSGGKEPPAADVQVPAELLTSPRAAPSLLSEVPAAPSVEPIPDAVPSVVIAPEAAAHIARVYELQLREKLLKEPPPTFWRRNRLKICSIAVVVVAVAAGAFFYRRTRERNKGNDLIALRSQAFGALALDTPRGYRDAIDAADRALALSTEDRDSLAAQAFAQAVLFHDFGRDPARAATARRLLDATREKHPGFALTIAALLAEEPAALEASRGAIRSALEANKLSMQEGAPPLESAQLLSAGGRLQLREGRAEAALELFKEALKRDQRHVATLLVLGDYYLSQSEPEEALQWFRAARTASPDHLLAALGIVDAQLALGLDPAADLAQAKELFGAADNGWPAGLKASIDLANGRALALEGHTADAIGLLDAGAREHRERAGDFLAALGQVHALSGDYAKAEAALSRALERKPGDAVLREELARALIAEGRAAEAFRRLDPVGADGRMLRVVRGLARLELGQHPKAREELALTARNGKVPSEAAIYLAMIDLAQGQADSLRPVLESAAKASKSRGTAQVALGRLALAQGREADAALAFRAAEADRRDWEGACSLGRLELKAGHLSEARKHLQLAFERNHQHLEARLALGQCLLLLGELALARSELEAAVAQGGLSQMAVPLTTLAAARRLLARVALAQGELSSARRHLGEAARLEPRNPELSRLGAQVAFALGNTGDGLRALERATRKNPGDPADHCELGEAMLKLGNTAAAKAAFQSAIRLDPASARARLGLVAAALPQGARAVARESEELVQASRGTALAARALALSARVHLAQGDLKLGGARARAAVAADDSCVDAHLALALVANNSRPRDDKLAVAELLRVVAADPVIAEAHLALAETLARDEKQQQGRAIAELETYLRMAPRGPYAETARKALARLRKKSGG